MTERPRRLRRAFSDAAATYEANATLQARVAASLADRIAACSLPASPRVLEIGCGTGLLTRFVLARRRVGWWLATDFAAPMAAACRAAAHAPPLTAPVLSVLVMDGQAPCLAPGGFDLICASLVFQWFDDLPAAFARLRPLLRPGGRLACATLGPDSLHSWRTALRDAGAATPDPGYPDPATLRAAWAGPTTIARERVVIRHPDGLAFLRGLRGIGAGIPPVGSARLPVATLRRALAHFEHGGCSVGYDVLYAVMR